MYVYAYISYRLVDQDELQAIPCKGSADGGVHAYQ